MMLIIFLLTALTTGWLEAFEMENGFHPGTPDFFGFKKSYHGALLLLAVLIGIGSGSVMALPWLILFEDLAFWAASKWALGYKFQLTRDSWIAQMIGNETIKGVMIPLIYPVLAALGYLTYTYL